MINYGSLNPFEEDLRRFFKKYGINLSYCNISFQRNVETLETIGYGNGIKKTIFTGPSSMSLDLEGVLDEEGLSLKFMAGEIIIEPKDDKPASRKDKEKLKIEILKTGYRRKFDI